MIGHNSVMIPHDGVFNKQKEINMNKPNTSFVPTQMSVAMAEAGVIPGTHLTRHFTTTGILRHKNDRANNRPSVNVAF